MIFISYLISYISYTDFYNNMFVLEKKNVANNEVRCTSLIIVYWYVFTAIVSNCHQSILDWLLLIQALFYSIGAIASRKKKQKKIHGLYRSVVQNNLSVTDEVIDSCLTTTVMFYTHSHTRAYTHAL